MEMTSQRVYVSATPGPFEIVNSRPDNKTFIAVKTKPDQVGYVDRKKLNIRPSGTDDPVESFEVRKAGAQLIVEQIIRPTGLLDPVIELLPLKGQIDATIELCRQRVLKGERALVTTLTKKTAEDLSEYLQNTGLKVRYIHADIDTIERVEILRQLRAGAFDVLVGINLLREGLDLPEVSLVCILDADKEGFLRNDTSLIQTAGRAARHINGVCYLFCDVVTDSIQKLLDITAKRRLRQQAFNDKHGIIPQSVVRGIQESLADSAGEKSSTAEMMAMVGEDEAAYDRPRMIAELETQMRAASSQLEFELAAHLRDQIKALKENTLPPPPPKVVNYRRKK
jgi:excinuclease ABC subunit B